MATNMSAYAFIFGPALVIFFMGWVILGTATKYRTCAIWLPAALCVIEMGFWRAEFGWPTNIAFALALQSFSLLIFTVILLVIYLRTKDR